MNTLQNLQWRYATKWYDVDRKLSNEQRHLITEALRLSPSSFGLQPWKFVHVTDKALREKLRAAAYNQSQLTDASDVFVLCSMTNLNEAYVDAFVASIAEQRSVPVEALKSLREMIVGAVIKGRTEESAREWAARQTYIALGVALAVAAENQIDASPMEGFDAAQFAGILGLTELGLQPCAVLAVGFRSPEDKAQNDRKVRFAENIVMLER